MLGKSKSGPRRIRLPFESSEESPYIFASYGHDDKEKVFPLLKKLYESGYNVWYDEGITIGEKYDEVIERHIRGSSVFLLFASELSLSRPYVLDVELKIARQIRNRTPLLTLFIGKQVKVPESVADLIDGTECRDMEEICRRLAGMNLKNFGRRKAVPVEREVPEYWFDSYDPEPSSEGGGVVFSAEKPYACLSFHPDDLALCNPYAKELYFAGYNVRSCERMNDSERGRMLADRSCRAYVPFVTKNYVESGMLERDYLAAREAGKPLVALYIRSTDEKGNAETYRLPQSIATEFSLLQGLDQSELTDNDFLSKLEAELEKRQCFARMDKGRVCRRSFEIKDFLYDFADGGKKLVLTRYRGEKGSADCEVRRAYYGFPVSQIGENAFRYRTDLKQIVLSGGISSVGAGAFSRCDGLEYVVLPESLKELGESAFAGCTSLKAVNLPEGIGVIPKSAFEDCDSLTGVIIPHGVTEIGRSAFAQCVELTSVGIPATVVSIGDTAFYQCECLTSAEIPDSVKRFGDGVFAWCVSLASLRLSRNMETLGAESFTGCSALEKIVIPEGITSIDDYAFYMADGLREVFLPESILRIGEHAFENCENLRTLTVPAGVTEIGENAFARCDHLECVTVLSYDAEIGEGALDDCGIVRCHEGSPVWEYCEEACVDCEPIE